jgi:acetyl esterase
MQATHLSSLLLGLLFGGPALAQKAARLDSKPQVLLIGDSISMGYTTGVKALLGQEAVVSRVRGNAGNTARGLARLEGWLAAKPGTWDVIHFNWGLWDLCYRSTNSKAQGKRDKVNGKLTATLEEYAQNLAKLSERLGQTGAHLIFATTTPVPEGEVGRKVGDDLRYNAVARALMLGKGVAINDLHATIGDRMAELASGPGNVHFNAAGNRVLSAQVAESIRRVLRQRNAQKRGKGVKAPKWQPTRSVVFKTIGDVNLKLHVFEPDHHQASDQRPAIVFFFGGGWTGGTPAQFYPHCEYLAARGMLACSAEYRVGSRHKTSPFECVADGKSALRWIRKHARELGVDPKRIAAGGGSAGGHVAAAIAMTPGLAEIGFQDASGSRPDALVLFNPVYDNGPGGYGHNRVKARWRLISPMHNIGPKPPPAVVFLGSKDKLIPVKTAETFRQRMQEVSVQSVLHVFEGRSHGFFNHGRGDGKDYQTSVFQMDTFLAGLGFLEGQPCPLR